MILKRAGTTRTTLLIALLAVGLLYAAFGRETHAQRQTERTGWQTKYEGKISKATFFALTDHVSDFLKGLAEEKVAEVTKALYASIYPLNEAARKPFTKNIEALVSARGKPVTYNFVKLYALDNTKRFYVISFISYHGDADVTGWEFEFVKVKGEWKIRDIRWDSDNPYRFLTRLERARSDR